MDEPFSKRIKVGATFVYENSDAHARPGFFASAKAPIVDAVWLGGEVSLSLAEGLPPFDASVLLSTTW